MALTGQQEATRAGVCPRVQHAVHRCSIAICSIAHDTIPGRRQSCSAGLHAAGLLNYSYDKESANFSRGDLADVLRTAADSPAVAEVTVLAHSMGAWLAMEALRQVALEDNSDLAKINNIVLASPDIDVDVFRRQLDDIGAERPLITVFTSSRDRALGISRCSRRRRHACRRRPRRGCDLSGEVRRRAGVSLHRHQPFAAGRRAQSQHLCDESQDRPADWRALAGRPADHRQRLGQPSRCRRNAWKRRAELGRHPISHFERQCNPVVIGRLAIGKKEPRGERQMSYICRPDTRFE